ncbi:MAG TPA: hypothetical protein VJI75_02065 [Candidatus Nanoarchaeia archaeon]|nr:hypothetical protein [Candidatus Nanoarchaeia archaeon]
MELELVKQEEMPLLSRQRYTFTLAFEGATPSRKDLRKEVSKKIGAEEDKVLIKHVYTRFGNPKAKIIAHVYPDRKTMEKIEEKYILKKHGIGVVEATPAAA